MYKITFIDMSWQVQQLQDNAVNVEKLQISFIFQQPCLKLLELAWINFVSLPIRL